jgi:hypothetical protein
LMLLATTETKPAPATPPPASVEPRIEKKETPVEPPKALTEEKPGSPTPPVVPEKKAEPPAPLPVKAPEKILPPPAELPKFTGVVIDTRGLGMKPSLILRILDEEGQELYRGKYVPQDKAAQNGLAFSPAI